MRGLCTLSCYSSGDFWPRSFRWIPTFLRWASLGPRSIICIFLNRLSSHWDAILRVSWLPVLPRCVAVVVLSSVWPPGRLVVILWKISYSFPASRSSPCRPDTTSLLAWCFCRGRSFLLVHHMSTAFDRVYAFRFPEITFFLSHVHPFLPCFCKHWSFSGFWYLWMMLFFSDEY